jgi:hypothetical protein
MGKLSAARLKMLQRLCKLRAGLILLAGVSALLAQLPPPAPPPPPPQPSLEFPASLQTKIVAGSTAAGTEVHAKLTLATLVGGVVIPEDAIFSGHVEQSVAKTKDTPSLLKIKFESAKWKKGSAPLNLYLVSCYYPVEFNNSTTDDRSGVHGDIGITMGGTPPPNSVPRSATGTSAIGPMDASHQDNFPDTRSVGTLSEVSKHWVRMEKVDTVPSPEGGLQMTSADRTIKLDRNTIYLLRNTPSGK